MWTSPPSARHHEERIITSTASQAFVEGLHPEDEHQIAARANAERVGAPAVSAATGATLAFLASAVQARAVAEIGTGAGVSGLWLLRGMPGDGILTSVDLEAENQRLAREAFRAAGFASQRFRLITGSALDVLPRLIDNGYDLVFVDGEKTEYGEYFTEALRLTKPGGLVVFDNALFHDKVADPAERDPRTSAIRELVQLVTDDPDLTSTLLPVGDGLLAVRKPA